MNGGNVSTGTIRCLIDKLGAEKCAEIQPSSFYIYNFPGMMEVTALFRPHTKIKNGLIKSFDVPKNEFFCTENEDLILFLGKEPNLHWEEFAECIFLLCKEFGVKMIYFIQRFRSRAAHPRTTPFLLGFGCPNQRDSQALRREFHELRGTGQHNYLSHSHLR